MNLTDYEARAARGDIDALVELVRYFGNGVHCAPDLGRALGWAEQAATLDAPDGYLEISRIIGSACIETAKVDLKKEYARYAIGTCDLQTLTRFSRPDIAANVGTIAEYRTGFGRANDFAIVEIDMYRESAELFYGLADGLIAQSGQPVDAQLIDYVHGAVGRIPLAVLPCYEPFRPAKDTVRLLPYRFKL